MPDLKWTAEDSRKASRQGWDLTYNSDKERLEIQRLDMKDKFASDADALWYVADRARAGSALHRKAVRIHCGLEE